MRRHLLCGLGAALWLSVAGCGGGGIEEGLPKDGDMKPAATMDPKYMVNPGNMGTAAANKAAAKNTAALKEAPAGGEAAAEKK
jgi:hypothetical protein